MSKTPSLADFFQKRVTANYITRTLHGNQHGPPWYLFHGDLPHTLKAGNQHGSQQNKTPLSVLREPSLAARLCMCGFGLQPRPTWNPTDIKNIS